MRIKGTLLKFNDHSLPKDFVSMAVCVDKDYQPFHAAILIRHNEINYLYHFPGREPPTIIENFNEEGWYIYKEIKALSTNDSSEVGSILQFCRRVCRESRITYGYIVDGSSYNDSGNFESKVGLPEISTCVGFCLNTLANILIDVEDSIVELGDWDDAHIPEHIDRWSQDQAEKRYPSLDWNLYNAFKKRITPDEYICISYFTQFPVKKSDVDRIKSPVLWEIRQIYSDK